MQGLSGQAQRLPSAMRCVQAVCGKTGTSATGTIPDKGNRGGQVRREHQTQGEKEEEELMEIFLIIFLGIVIGAIIGCALLALYGVWMVVVDELKDRKEDKDC